METTILYKNYFEKYTAFVPEKSVCDALKAQDVKLEEFISRVSEENAGYAY